MKSPGRPPKFSGPSRVVTVTLPETTLAQLAALDGDRAHAIVKATEAAVVALDAEVDGAVEMQTVSQRTAVVTVPHSEALNELSGLNLIQIRPSRYLIVLEPGTPLTEIEVSLLDRLETLADDEHRERTILLQLLASLQASRRTARTRIGELILFEI